MDHYSKNDVGSDRERTFSRKLLHTIMERKRKGPEPDLETIFATLYSNVDASSHPDEIRRFLRKSKKEMEGISVEDLHKTAESYTLELAVSDFNLMYDPIYGTNPHYWNIEALPDVVAMEPSHCLKKLLVAYSTIYDRSSEAARRIAVDLLLCDYIDQMRGKPQSTTDGFRPSMPKPSQKIKVYCDISFSHKINSKRLVVGGRVNHGVGITVASMNPQHFHSLLLCIDGILAKDLGQLVVYLASLRQSRIDRGKNDSSVYGVVSDGFIYIVVTITHEGVLKKTKPFDLNAGLAIVLGCFRFILEKALSMTPNASPTQGEQEVVEMVDADTVLTVHERKDGDDSEDEAE